MKWLARNLDEQNEAAVDPWTLVHFSAGLALGLMRAPLVPTLLGAAAYEVAEQVIERHRVGNRLFSMKGPESSLNVMVDLAVLVGGHFAGQRWLKTGSENS